MPGTSHQAESRQAGSSPPVSVTAARQSGRRIALTDVVEAAHTYTERGWHVFPLIPGTKRPAIPSHPEHRCDGRDPLCIDGHLGWEQRATTSSEQIEAFWANKSFGIAIATGPSQLLVIDLDVAKHPDRPSGYDSLAQLENEAGHRLPEETFTVATPSGGRHLYYHQDHEHRLRCSAGRLGPGIDTRGKGGYIIAPPTALADGRYSIECDKPPAQLPAWIAEQLRPAAPETPERPDGRCSTPTLVSARRRQRYVEAAVAGELDRIATAISGDRNNSLFRAAIAFGQLIASDLLEEARARRLLRKSAHPHVTAGAYDEAQANKTIESGLRRGFNEPREIGK